MASFARPDTCYTCTTKLCRYTPPTPGGRPHRVHELERGARIGACDGPCVKFWTVLAGSVAICTAFDDGRRQITAIERAGSTIGGPMAHAASPTWLEALEPTRICEVDLTADIAALTRDPGFMTAMFEAIHRRLEAANRHLTTLGRLDSTERVTLFLAQAAAAAPGDGPVHLALSREDIADYLGLNAETVSRVLSKLKKARLFRFLSPTDFVVPDLDAVARSLPLPVVHRPHRPMATLRAALSDPAGAGLSTSRDRLRADPAPQSPRRG